jgi:hypothetical protein
VAVATIDAVVTYVMFVAELNRLLSLDPLPGIPRRSIEFNGNPQSRDNDEDRAIDSNLR